MSQEMRKGLMVQFPVGRTRDYVCKNIGDYIQSVATRQYVYPIDQLIEQEEVDLYHSPDGRKIRLIMNGWFQWRSANWPPTDDICPLLVSMHISPLKANDLLTPKGIKFLKENGPVGCRDTWTLDLLKRNGIPAYFSGCVTLTLGKVFRVQDKEREGFYFVDPYFKIPPLYEEKDNCIILNKNRFNEFIEIYSNKSTVINSLAKRSFFKDYLPTGFLDRNTEYYNPYYKAVCFYKVYSKKFSDDFLLQANYVTHWLDIDMHHDTNEDMLRIAEKLVRKYASAKMVITSRIHAGLPCLGMGTPVIFIASEEVTSENSTFNVPGRLGGLLDFFRILNLKDGDFYSEDEILNKINKFTENTTFANKNNWKPYANRIDRQLSAFMSDDFKETDIPKVRNLSY